MRLFDLVRHRLRLPCRKEEGAEAPGDLCGPFGFGRPAHKPDPNARYGFEREQSRMLPLRREARWR